MQNILCVADATTLREQIVIMRLGQLRRHGGIAELAETEPGSGVTNRLSSDDVAAAAQTLILQPELSSCLPCGVPLPLRWRGRPGRSEATKDLALRHQVLATLARFFAPCGRSE
jgi:hypothetical protein